MIHHKAKKIALEEKIVEKIKTVYDPEIPVNIYDLGMIYEVRADENKNAFILMTFTSPNCPVMELLPAEIREKILTIPDVNEVEIEITFEPPWDQDMLSEEAKLELGLI